MMYLVGISRSQGLTNIKNKIGIITRLDINLDSWFSIQSGGSII